MKKHTKKHSNIPSYIGHNNLQKELQKQNVRFS